MGWYIINFVIKIKKKSNTASNSNTKMKLIVLNMDSDMICVWYIGSDSWFAIPTVSYSPNPVFVREFHTTRIIKRKLCINRENDSQRKNNSKNFKLGHASHIPWIKEATQKTTVQKKRKMKSNECTTCFL